MFEEGQLYSPVTTSEDGEVKVHLAPDHPGFADEAYRTRRNDIAKLALDWQPGEPAPDVGYSDEEHGVWQTVCRELRPKHEKLAIREFVEALDRLDLPTEYVARLDELSANLEPLTVFRFVPAPDLVPLRDFFGSLMNRVVH